MRGEYLGNCRITKNGLGSPPHARGICHRQGRCIDRGGLTPACAGNIEKTQQELANARAHPRMRGEYLKCHIKHLLLIGSPPHARGISWAETALHVRNGLTPACAGNIVVIKPFSARSKHKSCNLEHLLINIILIDIIASIAIRQSPMFLSHDNPFGIRNIFQLILRKS